MADTHTRRTTAGAIVIVAALIVGTATVFAQRRFAGNNNIAFTGTEPIPHNIKYDGRFTFARLRFTSAGPGGYYFRGTAPWTHGYPTSEYHLMKIIDFMTDLSPHLDESQILAIDDPELMKFPVAYATEVGWLSMTDKEVIALRSYIEKGGFLIVDDFRGQDWGYFEIQMARVFPNLRWQPMDASMKVYHSFFDINDLNIVPQAYDAGSPIFRGLFEDNDVNKRLLVIANYQTDVSEFWEYSDTGRFAVDLSNEAYKLGVNYVLYAITH